MLRLPATSIDLSQHDLNFHLQQLDIYQGLLKQGFKKKEIIHHFERQKQQVGRSADSIHDDLNATPSTYELTSKTLNLSSSGTAQSSLKPSLTSPTSPARALASVQESLVTATGLTGTPIPVNDRSHAPRQSSLLRFAHGVSPEALVEDNEQLRIAFSPRNNITYRPRSQTYSYDQSEIDPEDTENHGSLSCDEFEHLSLDQELVPTSAESARTVLRVASYLRPEAESFTPLHLKQHQDMTISKGKKRAEIEVSPVSDTTSMPSSPPLIPCQLPEDANHRSPSLPSMPHTPQAPNTALRSSRNRYLDGAFTVYDDAVPARYQPQTPADLSHGRLLTDTNVAYTAPPGMIRSPMSTHGRQIHAFRLTSGEQSPTTRAALIRDRRQREFVRGAQVEGLRITRTRDQRTADIGAQGNDVTNPWMDDLAADGVGEENFEDPALLATARGLRVISANRRQPLDFDD